MPRHTSRPPDDPAFLVGPTELAGLLGVHRRTVRRLRERGLEQTKPGKWALSEVLAWFQGDTFKQIQAGRIEDAMEGDAALTQARTELARAQRLKLELEIARQQKELLPIEDATFAMMGLAQIMTDSLDGFAPRLAGVVATETDPARCEHAIDAECAQLRRELARAIRQFERDYSPGGEPGGAPSPRRSGALG